MAALLGRSSEMVIVTSSRAIAAGVRLVEKVPVIVVDSASTWPSKVIVTTPAPTAILAGGAAFGALVGAGVTTYYFYSRPQQND